MLRTALVLLMFLHIQVGAGSSILCPGNFYLIDPNRSERLDGTVHDADFKLKAPVPFLGSLMCKDSQCTTPKTLWVNKDGIISYDTKIYYYPYRMGSNTGYFREALISPFWTWLSYGNGTGVVYYQQTSKISILKKAEYDVKSNFACARRFNPTTVLIVTWYNMPFDSCTKKKKVNKDDYCSCTNSYSPEFCECMTYPVEDYCKCVKNSKPEKCQCHDYYVDYYGSAYDLYYYCDCLNRRGELKATCDCYMDYGFEDLARCRYKATGIMDYAYCEWVWGWVYCECVWKFKGKYGDEKAWKFCDCVDDFLYVQSCMCPDKKNPEYCKCLDNYEKFLYYEEDQDSFETHDFCLCYAKNGDAAKCGCKNCPAETSKRGLPEVSEELVREDRSRVTPVLGDGSVKPWSEKHNTFQAVIVTDGEQTYVIYNYESLNVRQYRAIVGFDGYNTGSEFEHAYSYKETLYRLMTKSNVGVKGRWMYRLDRPQVLQPADC